MTIDDVRVAAGALGRGVPPSAVEDAIQNGTRPPGTQPGTTVYTGANGVTVVTGSGGRVITVIARSGDATMDELFARQMGVLRRLVSDYRAGNLSLNTLIQRVEGVGEVLGVQAWKDAVFPIVLLMEQVNAVALDAKRGLTEANKAAVENSLLELEALISQFDTK